MLKPSECFAGPISGGSGLTLVLPRTDSERRILLVGSGKELTAVFLDGSNGIEPFASFPCSDNDYWSGLHIPNVEIEIDETSISGRHETNAPLGAVTRIGETLALQAKDRSWTFQIELLKGLPACVAEKTATFQKWQIVLGSGADKRILHKIEVK